MKILSVITALLFFYQSHAQKNYNFDSLANRICESFKTTAAYPDSIKIEKAFEKHLAIFEKRSAPIKAKYLLYLVSTILCKFFLNSFAFCSDTV